MANNTAASEENVQLREQLMKDNACLIGGAAL